MADQPSINIMASKTAHPGHSPFPANLTSALKLSPEAASPAMYTFIALALLLGVVVSFRGPKTAGKLYPVVNKTEAEYFVNARNMVKDSMAKFGGKPFCIFTGIGGNVVILNPSYTEDFRSDPRLSSSKFPLQFWMLGIPGFEPYIALGTDLLHDVIKTHLTQKDMIRLAPRMSAEASRMLADLVGDKPLWTDGTVLTTLYPAISRVASLIFLGEELNNSTWFDVVVRYNTQVAVAGRVLRKYPRWMYRWVHWMLPECRELRTQLAEARAVIKPILEKRRAEGKTGQEDALEWYEEMAGREGIRYDAAEHQLGLAISAIQTSVDLVSQTLINLCKHPELIEPLRREIRTVLGDAGWGPNSLRDLKLLDSVCKETLRLKPVAVVAVSRLVTADYTLRDGTLLPRNTAAAISSERMWSPSVYANPDEFDGYRFLRAREATTAGERTSQLVSVTGDHFGFGFGVHACPGRYFGATSAKVMLSHVLMKYDFEMAADSPTEPLRLGFSQVADLRTKFRFRRREEAVGF